MSQKTAEDVVGVVRKHRWASVDVQTEKLQADGCKRILDLNKIERSQLVAMVRERTVIKVLYAFLIADQRKKGVNRMLADYQKFTDHLANLPRKCRGSIMDLDSGFLAETPAQRRAMLAVVRGQIASHLKNAKSVRNLPRGGQVKVFTTEQIDTARQIWENVRRYPTWEAAEAAFNERVPGFTKWRANRDFGKR